MGYTSLRQSGDGLDASTRQSSRREVGDSPALSRTSRRETIHWDPTPAHGSLDPTNAATSESHSNSRLVSSIGHWGRGYRASWEPATVVNPITGMVSGWCRVSWRARPCLSLRTEASLRSACSVGPRGGRGPRRSWTLVLPMHVKGLTYVCTALSEPSYGDRPHLREFEGVGGVRFQ
jgi:hypothetical protein